MVNFSGKIAILRYGYEYRGDKVKHAQDRGAAGAILFSDPAEVANFGTEAGGHLDYLVKKSLVFQYFLKRTDFLLWESREALSTRELAIRVRLCCLLARTSTVRKLWNKSVFGITQNII
jgi:hypothetical protein